jgi:lipopolysaccharide transport system ATP-binding protein
LPARLSAKELRVISGDREDPVAAPTAGEASSGRQPIGVRVTDATLRYPVGAHSRASLKSTLFSLVGHREARRRPSYVEAMRNLSLEISVGDRVGLIGHNGSGKSTLLRALAGIYPLTSGSIETVGRIGALLDISLGFETESTGRENIYYRGMAMGYSRKQIRAFEQEIVEFADLGEFIDLPMRTYSAGMYVRLGFAVSTQFEPEILLVDEVFGAGDAAFAQRAVPRMLNIVRKAGIVVIATHDLALVQQVCNRVLWLEGGRLRADGPPEAVVAEYLDSVQA